MTRTVLTLQLLACSTFFVLFFVVVEEKGNSFQESTESGQEKKPRGAQEIIPKFNQKEKKPST